jgi:hypothetical protein
MANALIVRRIERRRLRAEAFRKAELRVAQYMKRPLAFADSDRDIVGCITRVGLAICRGGGDHLGDADSIHADFARLVRLAFNRE